MSSVIPTLWCEKYRPRTVKDCILPSKLQSLFQSFVDSKDLPNLLLEGPAGTGKTTIARALCEELGYSYIIINASDERNIDTIRGKVKDFASTNSFSGAPKAIILDEGDFLSASSAQPALRAAMEEFHMCRFIITANYKNRLIEPIHSRCSVISFTDHKKEYNTLAAKFLKSVVNILQQEKIEFDVKVVAELVKKFYPDGRRIINELQSYSRSGKIDTGLLSVIDKYSINQLLLLLKEKNLTKIRQWVVDNADSDSSEIFRAIYEESYKELEPETIPEIILIIGKYQDLATRVVDQEINTMCMLLEILSFAKFK